MEEIKYQHNRLQAGKERLFWFDMRNKSCNRYNFDFKEKHRGIIYWAVELQILTEKYKIGSSVNQCSALAE